MWIPFRQDPAEPAVSFDSARRRIVGRIVRTYESAIVRLYCRIRFVIINMRILEELEQYLPKRGTVVDLGCGFGLFTLFFALRARERRFVSLDLNARRVAMARKAARRLGVDDRIEFLALNVLDYSFDSPAHAIIMIDIVHHIPRSAVPAILRRAHDILAPGGLLLLKEVEGRPWHKAMFTWLLDKLMDFRTPVNYYYREEIAALAGECGFQVRTHELIDILPYPHILYICRKKAR